MAAPLSSSTTTSPIPGWGAVLLDDRRRLLLLVLPLLALLTLVSAAVISVQPKVWTAELALFITVGAGLGLMALLVQRGTLAASYAAAIAPVLIGALLLERIFVLFLSGYFDTPGSSFSMPVFALLPLLYLLCFVMLEARASIRVAILTWLLMALIITWLTMPYWHERPLRESLPGLMMLVWIGHGLFVLLFAAGARRQQRVLARHMDLASSERRAREAMSDSESRFRRLFDLAAVSINVTDESGRYLMVNQGMADFLGYTRDELLEMDFRAVTLESDVADSERQSRRVADGTIETFRLEKRYRRKDGAIVYAEIFVRELDRVEGQSRRFICVGLDISERKRAEERALESRRIRDFHFDNTPLAVVEFMPDLSIKRWSRRAEKIFGWSEADAVGQTAEQLGLFAPEQFAARRERVGRMFRGEIDHISAVLPMCHRSGRSLWIEVHNSVTRNAEGEVLTLISMALDVTEGQEMLHMLNESEARFRGIFNQAAVGIALLDDQGRWLNVNDKLCEIVGYSMDELLERDFQSITHPDDIERDVLMAAAVMDRSIDQYNMEKRYIRKDGEIVWVMLFVRRLEATAHVPARFVSVVEDINERKLAESQIKAL
ncbi:MAG: PAS domain S-box protein, partial [Panacagrimonas sp.]